MLSDDAMEIVRNQAPLISSASAGPIVMAQILSESASFRYIDTDYAQHARSPLRSYGVVNLDHPAGSRYRFPNGLVLTADTTRMVENSERYIIEIVVMRTRRNITREALLAVMNETEAAETGARAADADRG